MIGKVVIIHLHYSFSSGLATTSDSFSDSWMNCMVSLKSLGILLLTEMILIFLDLDLVLHNTNRICVESNHTNIQFKVIFRYLSIFSESPSPRK